MVATAPTGSAPPYPGHDTIMGQHGPILHFGLGRETRVDALEVRWPSGATRVLRNPEIRRYHYVVPPEGAVAEEAGDG